MIGSGNSTSDAAIYGPALRIDADVFRERFNKRHFVLHHDLADHSAFDVEALVHLARKTSETRPRDVYFDEGTVEPGQRWATIGRGAMTVDETIQRLESRNAWIMIWRSDLVSPYDALLDRALRDIFALTGSEIERTIKKKEVILFITSPNRVTPYHIDRECNFLLQMRGRKQLSVFSRDEREVLPEREIEKFWACDSNAAVYRPELQNRATVIQMEPGNGVHIPVNAPHWVQNDNNVSVTASFNFQFRDHLRANVYRTNYYMRKIGLQPTPPFRHPTVDAVKKPVGALLNMARRLYHGPSHRELPLRDLATASIKSAVHAARTAVTTGGRRHVDLAADSPGRLTRPGNNP